MNINQIRGFITATVRYKDWEFLVKSKGDAIYLQIQFMAKNILTGNYERQYCRKWLLSEHMTKTELIRTCWKAVLAAVEHEAAEEFRFLGEPVFNPHYNVMRVVTDMTYGATYEIFDVREEVQSNASTSPEIEKDIQDEINDFNFKVKVEGASEN